MSVVARVGGFASRRSPHRGAPPREAVRRVAKVSPSFMGLLEEAIREHLDLQRRRGGDLRQIALAEREALEPLVPGHTPDWAQGPALFDNEQPVQAEPMPSGRPLVEPAQEVGQQFVELAPEDLRQPLAQLAPEAIASEPVRQMAEGASLDQETAELDMSAVLGFAEESAEPQVDRLEDHAGVPEFGPVRAQRIVQDPAAPVTGPEDFEWEIPGVTRSPGA